jgi:hypothetical protein
MIQSLLRCVAPSDHHADTSQIQILQLEQASLSRRIETCIQFEAEQQRMIAELETKICANKQVSSPWLRLQEIKKDYKVEQIKCNFVEHFASRCKVTAPVKRYSFTEYFVRRYQSKSLNVPHTRQFVSHTIWAPPEPFVSYANNR